MIVVVGTGPDGLPLYGFPVAEGADRDLPSPDAVLGLGRAPTAVVFGSYPAVLAPTAAPLRALAERLHSGAVICLDPNARPAIAREPAVWRGGLDGFLPVTDIVKASEDDIRFLYGPEAAVDAVTRDWLARGPSLVCVTRGAAGASAYRPGRPPIAVAAPRVDVTDTVGAGDSFLAALLSRLERAGTLTRGGLATLAPETLAAAMRFAVGAAAITCGRRGADLPRKSELPL